MTSTDLYDMGTKSSPSADLIENYLHYLEFIQQASPETIRVRANTLPRVDRELPYGLDQATSTEIAMWIKKPCHKKATTRDTYDASLRSFYEFCTGRFLDHNPMDELPRPKVSHGPPRPADDEHVRKILTEATEPFRTWATIAAYAGARCIEISRLKREDITPEVVYLLGKGNKPRAVDTYPALWALAQSLPPGHIAPHTNHFISIRSAMHFKRCLHVPVSMHMLRHWYLTKILNMTGDARLAQELAGHASLNTTMRYLQVASGRRRNAVMALPDLTQAVAADDRAA